MPIDYNKAKIYCIRSPHTDLIYIGSTCQNLCQRMSGHRSDIKLLKNSSSKIIIEYGESYIELLENYPCNNKEELLKKEGEYIRNNNCCNKCIAGRTEKQWREDNKKKEIKRCKEYKENNKETIYQQRKEYYKKNKDKINEQYKQWKEKNKEQRKEYMKEYMKEYYKKNKDKNNI